MRHWLVAPVLLIACSSAVKQDFQATYAEVTRAPPPLPTDWEPDVRVRVAPAVVEAAVKAAINGVDLDTYLDIPGGRIEPKLAVDDLKIKPPKTACEDCMGIRGSLAGTVDYKLMGFAGRAKIRVHIGIDTRLHVRQEPDGWVVVADPPIVTHLETDAELLNRTVSDFVLNPIARWVSSTLAERVPPILLARLGRIDLPLQAARLSVQDGVVALDARTTAPGDQVAGVPVDPGGGFTSRMALASVEAAARQATFQQGSLGMGVWVDPRHITMEDDQLLLDLRLWRVAGAGWWRDYQIRADMSLEGGKLTLRSDDVTQTGTSPGAGLVDPIAALMQGKILDIIASAVNTSIPTSRTQDIQGTRSTWELLLMNQFEEDLQVVGRATFDNTAP